VALVMPFVTMGDILLPMNRQRVDNLPAVGMMGVVTRKGCHYRLPVGEWCFAPQEAAPHAFLREIPVAGRPSELTDKVMKQAKQLALLGCTDEQMASIWDVSTTTIDNWKKQYPKFLGAIKSGKEEADAKIAEALYHRAKGYKRKETKVFCHQGEIITHEYEEHMAPDTAAAFIWLKNRQGKNWRDKHEVEATNTNLNLTPKDDMAADELQSVLKNLLGRE